MTVVINASNNKNIAELLSDKFKKEPQKGTLIKHFGKLKRNIDGLEYQQKIRSDED